MAVRKVITRTNVAGSRGSFLPDGLGETAEEEFTPRERRLIERRNAIFQAAIELFSQHGVERVTVGQIAKRADVAKGTFFGYFPTKEAILVYFASDQAKRLEDAVKRQEISGAPPDRIRQAIRLLAAHPQLTRELGRGLFVSALAVQKPAEVQGPSIWRLQGLLAAIVLDGQERGLFRPDLNCEETALFLLGQHFLALLVWCAGFWERSLVEVTDSYVDLALEGMVLPSASLES
jgi:AcrR family transcriptional regulator